MPPGSANSPPGKLCCSEKRDFSSLARSVLSSWLGDCGGDHALGESSQWRILATTTTIFAGVFMRWITQDAMESTFVDDKKSGRFAAIPRAGRKSKFLSCKGAGMKRHLVLVVLSLTALLGNLAWAGSAREDATERLQNSANVLKEIGAAPDKGIPDEVLKGSQCIVVVPHLVKAGFIFGAKHGRGVAVCRTSEGWSAPAFITVGGGSWGLQIGAEGVDLVMLVMNHKGLQHLLSSKFELTGEGSAAAGPVGRHASAGTDWKLNTEMLTYSRSRGVFAGLTLEGAVVERDADSTVAIYGSDIPFKKILLGEVAAPASAAPFLRAVAEINHQARAQEALEQAPQAQQEDQKPPEDQKKEDQK